MKNKIYIYLSLFILVISFPTINSAQGLPYTEGTVWDITFVRTKPGMDNEYLRNLASEWQKQNDELKNRELFFHTKFFPDLQPIRRIGTLC